MKLQEDKPPGEQKQYTCALTFPTSAQRSCGTEEDEEEQRCSGTERRPFNAIRGCASGDHEGIAWYDSVNYRDVAGDIRKNNRAPSTSFPNSNAFLIQDAEEECVRGPRGGFVPHFGTGWPLGRRFSFYGPDSGQPKDFVIDEVRGCLLAPFDGLFATANAPTCSEAPGVVKNNRRSKRPRYERVQLAQPKSTVVARL
ncbi:hypothetical protein MRX96_014081 [Rhipicephalus microplus]